MRICKHVYMYVYTVCTSVYVYVYEYVYLYMLPFQRIIYRKKNQWKTATICLLQTDNANSKLLFVYCKGKRKRKSVFLGRKR